ncbi:MAG: uncharacterized protein A8A55_1751 [Amphiamblys sp. WSBS2006]|nr:MAG: uncharacterized protein A8A55_1751 [Amphiamblys sp. WSBS2006]
MKILSVSLATIPVCLCALSNSFTYVPKDILPRFQTEQERSIYILSERKQADKLCSVYFRYDGGDKRVSLLRFVYDETEAKTRYPNARGIAEEVARFVASHAEVDTGRKLFFVSFANDVSPLQAVPEGIAEVFVVGSKESSINYYYKKERDHGNIFDRFLVVEECKREDKNKKPRIKNFPEKRKEAVLLLSFLAVKEIQLDLKTALSIQEEKNKHRLQIPYGVNLFVSEENSCCLELFDLAETRIKKLAVSSFDVTRMNLKNTHIEELFLVDEAALVFFYDKMERSEFYVERVSFGSRLNPKSEKIFKLIKRVHEGENVAPRKIKKVTLSRDNFFGFLKETSSISQRKIHVEDLAVTQNGKSNGPRTETSTRIVVSKKIGITGSACVLLFIEFGPELSHLNIDEIQRQCHSPEIDIPRINIRLTKNKIAVKGNCYVLEFLKKNITATEVCFFANKRKKEFRSTKITLVSGEMESICFGGRGLSVLPSITNKKINVRHMEVIDTMCFSKEEEIKKKEFVIRESLYMRNTGVFFLGCLGNTVFIPVIEIEVGGWKENWDGFEETTSIHIDTNALVENNIGPKTKQKIGEMIIQKETVVEGKPGYQKLVFKEDLWYEEQNEPGESEEQPITKYKEQELCFKEKSKRDLYYYDFSGYLYGDYED